MQQKYFLVIITSNFTVTLLLLELPLYKNSFCPYKQYLLDVKQYFVCLVHILILIVFESKLVKISQLSNKLFVMFKSALQNFDALNIVAHKILTLQLKSFSIKFLTFWLFVQACVSFFLLNLFFHHMVALQKLWKMFSIWSKKLFLFRRYSIFSIFSFSFCQSLL